jgi:hypothetical protein
MYKKSKTGRQISLKSMRYLRNVEFNKHLNTSHWFTCRLGHNKHLNTSHWFICRLGHIYFCLKLPVFSHHDLTEILLKMMLNTINQSKPISGKKKICRLARRWCVKFYPRPNGRPSFCTSHIWCPLNDLTSP